MLKRLPSPLVLGCWRATNRSQTLRLAIDPQHPFQVTEIDKRTIEEEQVSPISFMPEGLLDTLLAAEIRDLIAFIESGGRQ